MRKFLSIVVILAVFLLQLHGAAHSDVSDHDKGPSCHICEAVSLQPGLVPTRINFNISSSLVSEKIFLISETNLSFNSFISNSIAPRAPPFS